MPCDWLAAVSFFFNSPVLSVFFILKVMALYNFDNIHYSYPLLGTQVSENIISRTDFGGNRFFTVFLLAYPEICAFVSEHALSKPTDKSICKSTSPIFELLKWLDVSYLSVDEIVPKICITCYLNIICWTLHNLLISIITGDTCSSISFTIKLWAKDTLVSDITRVKNIHVKCMLNSCFGE